MFHARSQILEIMDTPNKTWLSGNWQVSDGTVTINTGLPSVTYGDFHAEGQDAQDIIDEIHQNWLNSNTTMFQCLETWAQSIEQ